MNITTLGTTELALIIVLAVIVVAVVAAWLVFRKRRTERLRAQFGAEYDRAVKEDGSRRHAEARLKERTERVGSLNIRPPRSRWSCTLRRVVAQDPGALR